MFTKLRLLMLSAVVCSITIPVNVMATNGYFLIGFGSKSRAMGGVGVATNMGGMAAATNPATLIDSETQFDISGELFHPPRAIFHRSTRLGDTNVESNHNLFMIPAMGISYKWNDRITLGAAMIGAGLKTEYPQSCAGPAGSPCGVVNTLNQTASNEAGVELYQMQMLPSIAYRYDDTHTFGFTFVMAGQYFRSEGLQDFADLGFTATGGPEGLTDEGFSHSFGWGVRFGWLGKFMNDDLKIGVNISPEVDMNHFARYKNLFAQGGDFNIPENYAIGFNYKVSDDLNVSFDIHQINYTSVTSVANPGPNAADPGNLFVLCPGANKDPCKLGGPKGLGFGWTDQTVFKIGGEWQYTEKWALRGGLNYGEAPIPEDQVLFNMLAPATPELHLTVGAEYVWSKDYILNFNYMHAFLNTIKGPTAFGPAGGVPVSGSNASIAMSQNSLGAQLEVKF